MKRSLFILCLVLMFINAACSSPAAEPTPTPTPAPPTSTPIPSATSTPVPTATPNLAATAEFRATQSAGDVLLELEDILGESELPYKDGSLLWQQKERQDIQLRGPDSRYQPFAEDINGKNFILKSDVTWNATGILICGIIFRSEPNFEEGKQYNFLFLRFSGAPAWAIEFHEFGRFKNSPTRVQYSSAVDLSNGATNQVLLVVNEEQFNVYINGVHQGRYFDYSKQSTEGGFAFVGLQDSGEGSCKYENSWVWELKPSNP
ncbi:MAG: hypothetical protein DPW18_16090 [Chloroflexi bacterium]|nr:MAG: hypothetical protein EDM79_21395 [Chloroflexota bacterium]MCQ3938548.1 hypothetical protein [Chloroflexota bacterium]MDL1944943.1 hypothetical protein [Chloroflexi bacterium CFX2]